MEIAILVACIGFAGILRLSLEARTMLPLVAYTTAVLGLFGFTILVRFLTHY